MPPTSSHTDRFFGLFVPETTNAGLPSLVRREALPASIPDPGTGQPLRIATVDSPARAICPSCASTGEGGFVSFVGDLRLAYACPACLQMVWLPGA
ncbi:MAG TPA: hypothetical protein PLH72_14230 [Vicinamibacterales bacterium]|nr:hypothetical protein [Vicinamibacterales bacterium]